MSNDESDLPFWCPRITHPDDLEMIEIRGDFFEYVKREWVDYSAINIIVKHTKAEYKVVLDWDDGRIFLTEGWEKFAASSYIAVGSRPIFLSVKHDDGYILLYDPDFRPKEDVLFDEFYSSSGLLTTSSRICIVNSIHNCKHDFIRVLLEMSDLRRLKIPHKFVETHRVGLATEMNLVGPDYESLRVGLEEIDGQLFFSKGWSKFLLNYNALRGCTLHFYLIFDEQIKTHFRVDFSHINPGKFTLLDNLILDGHSNSYPSFAAVIKESNLYSLEIPNAFMNATGLIGKNWIDFRNDEGCHFPVKISFREGEHYFFTTGWNRFKTNCNILAGMILTIEFVSDDGHPYLRVRAQDM